MEMTDPPDVPWWKGRRGEWCVAIQVALLLLVAFGPRTAARLPAWPPGTRAWSSPLGAVLMAGGLAWILAGGVQLAFARSLSPLPRPATCGTLIDTGVFGLVRHPMYCGGIWAAVGWALWTQGPLTLAYAVALALFADVKASREERWLAAKFREYEAYRARVRKLIPFVY